MSDPIYVKLPDSNNPDTFARRVLQKKCYVENPSPEQTTAYKKELEKMGVRTTGDRRKLDVRKYLKGIRILLSQVLEIDRNKLAPCPVRQKPEPKPEPQRPAKPEPKPAPKKEPEKKEPPASKPAPAPAPRPAPRPAPKPAPKPKPGGRIIP